MKVSFVIPAYNEEALLGACIDSIVDEVARSGAECEIIVVDNGSTDATALVAKRRGARVVREPRSGLPWARQAGLDAACGEYVASVDADSLVPTGWLDVALRELHGGAVAVTGPLTLTGVPRVVELLSLSFYTVAWLVAIAGGVMVQGGNVVARRDALVAAGGYDTTIEFHGEDTDTAVRLARVGRIAWRWRMRMPSSGRRLASEGAFLTGVRYAANYLSVIMRGRPLTTTHRDIR